MTLEDEQRQLLAVREQLLREFADRLDADDVTASLTRTVRSFDGAPVRTFVPVLAARQARQELAEQV